MTSPNFGFLAPDYAVLATLGANAEAYARQDPAAALVKLRLFGEQLSSAIAHFSGLEIPPNVKQIELIELYRVQWTAS